MTLGWKEIKPGFVILEVGSSRSLRTGDWRTEHPVLDRDKCNKCGFCYLYCPEGTIHEDEEGYFVPDLYYCKGCGICAHECPQKAITMQPEV